MNKLVKVLAVAIPLAFSLNASASTYVVGSATDGNTYSNLFDYSGSFNDGAHLSDLLTFDLATAATVTAFSNAPGAIINFLALPGFGFVPGSAGPSPDSVNLGAGSYQVVFKSLLGSTGSFTGGISVAAVPEPETYALMLAGLGLIGFSARRRQA
ncbi:MAG: FxDxF family PEP-CTERM protein [Methylophilaceae bacterium]